MTPTDGWIYIWQWLTFFAGLGVIAICVIVMVLILLDRWL